MGARARVVILGGGFGGLRAARKLAAADVEIVLIDRNNHHLFQPLLYQVATAGLAPSSIAQPIRSILSTQRNARVMLGEAHRLDRRRREVELRDGEIVPYDFLVIAVGARTNYYGNEEAWGPHALGLKSLRDALGIRERILLAFEAAERCDDPDERARHTTFVVVGGGATGVEMAGAISELGRHVLAGDFRRIRPEGVRVVLAEMADRVLLPFDEDLSASAQRQLRQLGVELRLGSRVVAVHADRVEFADGSVPASVIVWASGVKPESFAVASGLPLDRTGRILVDARCAAVGHPEIFAIGDIACQLPEGSDEPLPGLAAVAVQQGTFVAGEIARALAGRSRRVFKYRDRGIMATIGRSRAVAQGSIKLEGLVAWLAWSLVHLVLLMGFRNRSIVLFNWIWSYLTFERGARLITRGERLPPAGG